VAPSVGCGFLFSTVSANVIGYNDCYDGNYGCDDRKSNDIPIWSGPSVVLNGTARVDGGGEYYE